MLRSGKGKMALPQNYASFEVYLEECLAFLKEYSWIYNAPNTHLLSSKALQKSSSDWIEYFSQISNESLNKLAAGEVEDQAPATLKQFCETIKSFTTTFDRYVKEVIVYFPRNSPISQKKKHEIVSLVPVINEIYEKTDCDTIFDIGCGLGYISQILNQQFDYKVIGIEGNGKKIALAEQYQKKFYSSTPDKVEYFEHMVTDNSTVYLRELHRTKFNSKGNVCMIGLHVCADLCVTVLDLFLRLDFVKGLVVMPCCYHMMTMRECGNSTESFFKFPCSGIFRKKYEDINGNQFLKRTFLRMAAQRSNENWKDLTKEEHEFRGKNFLFRAIIQEIATEENWTIKRLKRKSGLRMDESYDINLAAENLRATHQLLTEDGDVIDARLLNDKLFEKWEIYRDLYVVIEAIVVLQNTMQSMCENLVLLDRIEYLKEKGIDSFVCKVTDDMISPRCFAIVATKDKDQ